MGNPENGPESSEVPPQDQCERVFDFLNKNRISPFAGSLLALLEKRKRVCQWLFTDNPTLGGATPAQMIEQKRFKEVLEAIGNRI